MIPALPSIGEVWAVTTPALASASRLIRMGAEFEGKAG